MITQFYGTLEQSEKKEIGISGALSIRINIPGYTGPWVNNLMLTWDLYGNPCDADSIDVSSNSPWTIQAIGTSWSLSESSGPAGLTNISIGYIPDIVPESAIFRFKIGSTTMSRLDTQSIDSELCI